MYKIRWCESTLKRPRFNTRAQLLLRWPLKVAQVEKCRDGVSQFSEAVVSTVVSSNMAVNHTLLES